MTATNIDIAEKQSDSQQKSARKERMEEKLTAKTTDKGHNTNELAATTKYETVPPTCSSHGSHLFWGVTRNRVNFGQKMR